MDEVIDPHNIICKNKNQIDISQEKWLELNLIHSKDEVKEIIYRAILDNDLELPYRDITLKSCKNDFKKLKETNLQFVAQEKWFSRYDYKYDFLDLVIPSSNVGNRSSDYFHQKSRWMCDSINAPSPQRTWSEERFLRTLLGALWTLKYDHVDNTVLRSIIGLRKYIAAQFRPSAAKLLYEHFEAKNILDFCSGWGDRLSGFMASEEGVSYTGIDPNSRLHPDYQRQIDTFGKDRSVNMINGCAEDDLSLPDGFFDFIMTSPPYFNIERYTQEPSQSFKRHNKRASGQEKLDTWLEGFLYPSIERAWKSLKPNGHMAINISDVYSGHRINNICDPMNDYISGLKNSKYQGAIGYQMRKRPNSGALRGKAGVFCEPIWVWKKKFKELDS